MQKKVPNAQFFITFYKTALARNEVYLSVMCKMVSFKKEYLSGLHIIQYGTLYSGKNFRFMDFKFLQR